MDTLLNLPVDFTGMERIETYGVTEEIQPKPFAPIPPIQLPIITTTTIHIARAKTGAKEIRLLSQVENGQHKHYLIDNVTIWPYTCNKKALMVSRKKKSTPVPMTETEAIAAFELEIISQFPTEKLKNGKSVAIHSNIM